jgi:predicted nucleic acid-binding protein
MSSNGIRQQHPAIRIDYSSLYCRVNSYQVIQETLNVVTRKLPSPMSTENARRFLEQILIPLWQTMPSLALYQQDLELQLRYGFSFYDALIVAAALESGCTRLYTEDLQHGQQVGELLIENPFRE